MGEDEETSSREEPLFLQATLTTGSWEVYCPVGDHAEARGMETTLQVGSAS